MTFPGNTGYRFLNQTSVNPDTPSTLTSSLNFKAFSTRRNSDVEAALEAQMTLALKNRRYALIVGSDKAKYRYHLSEMYSGTKKLLESLRIQCKIVEGETLEHNLRSLLPSIDDLHIMIDNEITMSEFTHVKRFVSARNLRRLNLRLILQCYDLWLEND